jgi:hypothetical protein
MAMNHFHLRETWSGGLLMALLQTANTEACLRISELVKFAWRLGVCILNKCPGPNAA